MIRANKATAGAGGQITVVRTVNVKSGSPLTETVDLSKDYVITVCKKIATSAIQTKYYSITAGVLDTTHGDEDMSASLSGTTFTLSSSSNIDADATVIEA